MLKKILLLLCFPVGIYAQRYQSIHKSAVVIDTHNDFLTQALEKNVRFDETLKGRTHSDLKRMGEGGIDIQVFSIWCDGSYGKDKAFARANREIDTLNAYIARHPQEMMLVKTPKELQLAVKQKKLGAMIGVEGGHMIEDDLSYLDRLFARGARYMTLTWNNSTSWATSAMEETKNSFKNPKKGLSDFGVQIVKRMNELGMIVDLSHVGEQTFWDAINTSTKPVIASHSCVHQIAPVFRNLNDEQIKAIGKNGGVIHLNFFSGFVDTAYDARIKAFNAKHKAERDTIMLLNPDKNFAEEYLAEKYAEEAKDIRPPLSMLLDHLDYIVKLIGVDHVGLGSDFDGISSAPQQLDDVTSYPLITKALLERGYSKKDVRKILGENFIRVFKQNYVERK